MPDRPDPNIDASGRASQEFIAWARSQQTAYEAKRARYRTIHPHRTLEDLAIQLEVDAPRPQEPLQGALPPPVDAE